MVVHSTSEVWMRAPATAIYPLAAAVERWPELLPHYRWVALLERKGNRRLVAMSAHRDRFPITWHAIQALYPDEPRITFRHVRGVTLGMEVSWTFQEQDGGTLVRITHDLELRWPLVGEWVARRIIAPHFIEYIARKTLRRIKQLAEASR